MKAEWRIFAGLGLVLAPWTVLYLVTSDDRAGGALLVLLVVSFLFVAVYLLVLSRQVGVRPEDRTDAEPADGAGTVGYFPTASVWPATLALGTTVMAYGLVFSRWIALPGGAIFIFAITGWAVEAHRAHHA